MESSFHPFSKSNGFNPSDAFLCVSALCGLICSVFLSSYLDYESVLSFFNGGKVLFQPILWLSFILFLFFSFVFLSGHLLCDVFLPFLFFLFFMTEGCLVCTYLRFFGASGILNYMFVSGIGCFLLVIGCLKGAGVCREFSRSFRTGQPVSAGFLIKRYLSVFPFFLFAYIFDFICFRLFLKIFI